MSKPIFVAADSDLLRYLRDYRFLVTLPRAVSLQMLHPTIAIATKEFVPYKLWLHKKHTVTKMIELAGSGGSASDFMHRGHEQVKGRVAGARYHALNPDVFAFQHATYVDTLFTAVNTFMHPMSVDECNDLYEQTYQWYLSYGVSARALPRSWDEFEVYFADACSSQLSLSAAGAELAAVAIRPDAWIPKRVPSAVIRTLLHPAALRLLNVETGRRDQLAFRAYAAALRVAPTGGHTKKNSPR